MKYFKNLTKNSADFYVYGEIVGEKDEFWDGNSAVDPNIMKEELDELKSQGIRTLNIYINSPGGDVFATTTMISMIKRFKETSGAQVHAYIDGVAASAASFLALVADDVNVYQNSIMMIHKPMLVSFGNADDLQKDIDLLNSLEDNTMIPLYMGKAKVSEDEIKDLIAAETWFNGNENDEMFIGNFFDVNYLDQATAVTACASKKLFKNYKHIPEVLKNVEEQPVEKSVEETEKTQEQPVEKESLDNSESLDYSEFDDTIKLLKH